MFIERRLEESVAEQRTEEGEDGDGVRSYRLSDAARANSL